ncbi:hypothetical protein D910_03889 [Dendroctonus ponderosae]
MACVSDCLDMSPPPDTILFMPPPPAPQFLFPNLDSYNATNCFATQSCDAATAFLNHKGNFRNLDRIEYMEMPSKEAEAKWNVSGIGDTWLLVLVASSIGVLLLGALLAMFLIKCREMHLFGHTEHCSLHTSSLKHLEPRDCNTLPNGNSKLGHPMNTSFYTPTPRLQDNRMVWAAITPRGTEHFISENNYSRNLVCYEPPPEDHYESIDNLPPQRRHENSNHVAYYGYHKEFDYDDPTPLIEHYQMGDIEYVGDHQYQIIGNSDMRCSSLALNQQSLARHIPILKSRVSSPTRIEHPNLPPLNLLPQRSANNTLKKNSINYRTMDPGKLSKSILPMACLWAGFFVRSEAHDFVIPIEGEELLYKTSEVFTKQIAVINSSAQIGVVLDPLGDRVLILNGETGRGVVLNKRLGFGVEVESSGWSIYKESLQDYLKDVDIDGLVDENDDREFQFEVASGGEARAFIHNSLRRFAPDFLAEIQEDAGDLISGVLRFFGFIIYPLKVTLAPLLNMVTTSWVVFKGGFLALVNIFKWIGKLVAAIPGGVGMLAIAAVQLPLSAIIEAADGAKAFFFILRAIARSLNLMNVLKFVLTSAAEITKFIVGLGGLVVKGITGIFSIVSRLFSFNIWKIGSAIKGFTELILTFIRGDRVSHDTVKNSCKELLTIPNEQQTQFGNGEEFREYREFLGGVSGDVSYKIHGVVVAPFVKILTQRSSSAKATIVSALDMLNPLVPFHVSLPQLLVNMVKSLNTTEGSAYVEQLMPNLRIPKDALSEAGNVLRAGVPEESIEEMVNLPAPDLLRKVPIVRDIYNELDEAALQYRNASLDTFLESHHVGELVEFTTKAIGLVR